MTREYAWGPSGQRVVDSVPRQRGQVLSVAGAIGLDGVRAVMAYDGATTKEIFLRFVREALVPALRPGDVVVMDNLGAHRALGVRDAIEAAGARVLYLPPYHPELNPIELAWSKWKNLLRKVGARTHRTLAIALRDTIELITTRDLRGWYQHAGALNQVA
jgi:transposase